MSKIRPSIKLEIDFDTLVAEYLRNNFPQYLDKNGMPNYITVHQSDSYEQSPEAVHALLDSGPFRESCYVIGYNCNATIENEIVEKAAGRSVRLAFEFGSIVLALEYNRDYDKKEGEK
jgi:hypothetical protein